jgi:hypothetical protein
MLDSLTRLSHEIPPDIQDALFVLASECLFEKGACVITARSYFPDSVFYNVCEEFTIPSARYADTGLDERKQNEKSVNVIKVYPNPASDFFTVELPDSLSSIVFELFDASGKMILQEHIRRTVERIYTTGLSGGLYYYRAINSGVLNGKGLLMLDKNR